jgi:membrane protein required for beta-lactamase induction
MCNTLLVAVFLSLSVVILLVFPSCSFPFSSTSLFFSFLCSLVSLSHQKVKHAVGIWRAAALRAKCHSNNVRAGDESRCALPEQGLHIAVPDFQVTPRVFVATLLFFAGFFSVNRAYYR